MPDMGVAKEAVNEYHQSCSCITEGRYGRTTKYCPIHEQLDRELKSQKKLEQKEANVDKHYEAVNHPPHYRRGGLELIDIIDAWEMDFYTATILQYLFRAPYKGKRLEDLEKGLWYLKRYVELVKKGDKNGKEKEDSK